MFIRTKKASRNERTYVQLVESYRENGRIKQRVLRHIGTAETDEEVEQLNQLGISIKKEYELKNLKHRGSKVDGSYAGFIGHLKHVSKETQLSLFYAEEEKRYTLGLHDVYGYVYDAVGFTNLFSRPKQRTKAAEILKEIVLARIANPASKRASVEMLEQQFGTKLNLDNVYQMMDKIDEGFCERIQKQALLTTLNLTGEQLNILFYDATTLYFESFTEDDLKQNGYSKDMKFNQPQVLLALFVTQKGLPVGYAVFPGKTYEGHTLQPVLDKLKSRYNINDVVFVADRGMLSKDNINYLNKNGFHYIVGSRIKSLKKKKQDEILSWINTLDKENIEDEMTHAIQLEGSQKLILSYCVSRARKDKVEREKAIQKLQARLSKSKNPKQLISNYGYQKFINVAGDATLQIDHNKMQAAAVWDGIIGVTTNHPELTNQQVLEQYRGLWQVEESFRITKHDLKIRPIYHWTPTRVRAHIAIAFMAFVCVRYLEYRVATQYQKISPEEIRKNLMAVQASTIIDKKNKKRYLLPSPISSTAKHIYRVLGMKLPQGLMKIRND